MLGDEVDYVMRLQNLDQENCDNVARVSVESLVVFLSLEDVDQIPSLNRNCSDVVDFILPFLLMVWWIWNFELLLVPCFIHLHEAKLGEAVLVADSI